MLSNACMSTQSILLSVLLLSLGSACGEDGQPADSPNLTWAFTLDGAPALCEDLSLDSVEVMAENGSYLLHCDEGGANIALGGELVTLRPIQSYPDADDQAVVAEVSQPVEDGDTAHFEIPLAWVDVSWSFAGGAACERYQRGYDTIMVEAGSYGRWWVGNEPHYQVPCGADGLAILLMPGAQEIAVGAYENKSLSDGEEPMTPLWSDRMPVDVAPDGASLAVTLDPTAE